MSDKCQRSTYIFNFTIHFLYIPVPTFCKKQIHWSLVNIFNCLGWSNMDENLHDMMVTDMTPYGMLLHMAKKSKTN